MQVRESAQSLLLERIWHRSQGKGGPNEAPPHTRRWPNPLSPLNFEPQAFPQVGTIVPIVRVRV